MNTSLTTLRRLAVDFARDRSANTAMLFAILLIPIALAAGFAIDIRRMESARAYSQEVIDSAALASASSRETRPGVLIANTEQNVRDTLGRRSIDVEDLDVRVVDGREITVAMQGRTPAAFGRLWGRTHMDFQTTSTAIRGITDTLEVVLVLDNTWSMSQSAGPGVTRIQALRTAAEDLVRTVADEAEDNARFALVPYADYVNVGTAYRNAAWINVPADRDEPHRDGPRTCRDETRTTRRVCTPTGPRQTCTRPRSQTIDGVTTTWTETYDCTPQDCRDQTVAPYTVNVCRGGDPTRYRWFGCVASRRPGNTRLNDGSPAERYPGLSQTSQTCLNPIVPLTTNDASIVNSIRALIINRGSYQPATHIPSGLVWGVNMLSPTAPFTEGGAYGVDNRRPRKIMVLMTDGENTLGFHPGTGEHRAPHANQANGDTVAVCAYAHSREIEVYSVAMAVDSDAGRSTMRACASHPNNYFEASNAAELQAAFAAIAASITTVRLAH